MALQRYEDEPRHLRPVSRPEYRYDDRFVSWAAEFGRNALTLAGAVLHYPERAVHVQAPVLRLVVPPPENPFGNGFD